MNRCSVCNCTDEDTQVHISLYTNIAGMSEAVCLSCANSISENIEDLSVNDIDETEVNSDWYQATLPF